MVSRTFRGILLGTGMTGLLLGTAAPAVAAPPPPPAISGWSVACTSTFTDTDGSVHAVYTVSMTFASSNGGRIEARVYELSGTNALWSEAAWYQRGTWAFAQTYPAAHVGDTVHFVLHLMRARQHQLVDVTTPVVTGDYTGASCPG